MCFAFGSWPLANAEGSGNLPDGAQGHIDSKQFGNTGIEECRAAVSKYLEDIHSGITPKALALDVTASKTLGDGDLTSYNGDVQIREKDSSGNPVVLDLNGKSITINGNLDISGTLYVNGGTLTVNGSITITNGLLKMTDAASTVYVKKVGTYYGNFVTDGKDHTGALTAGTLEVQGDFIQYSDYSSKAFCPTGTFKVKLSGTNKVLYFDTPAGSWLRNYEFASGITFKPESVFSLDLNLTAAETTMTYSHLYIRGNMGGKKLNVPGNTVVAGMLTLGGGQLNVAGALLVDYSGGITMNNANDRVTVAGNFQTGGSSSLQAGIVDISGNFTQFGVVSGFHDDSYVSLPAHKTIIRGTNRRIHFESPVISCFGQLDASAATLTADSEVSLNCDLTDPSTTWSYPVVYYGGHLNGNSLTVTNNLFARQITPGGGTLTAEKNFTSIAADCLVMTNTNDHVIVKGNFTANQSMNPASITKGVLEIQGNFSQSGTSTSFLASGTHKTILTGTAKSVVFANPGTSWFNEIELSPGMTFATGSVLSMKCSLAADMSLTVPMLYYSGSLVGNDLGVTGNLHLFDTVNPLGGTIKATGNVTLDGELTMADSVDRLEVGGDFTGAGKATLTAGSSEFKKSFRYTGASFAASGTHTTTLSGGAGMPVIFGNPAQGWFANITFAPGTTLSTDSVLSLRSSGLSNLTLTVPLLYMQGNLNGHSLALTGNMTVPPGTAFAIGGGSCTLSGNMLLDNGTLEMTNAADVLTVNGNFTAKGPDHTGKLTNGKLIVKGNFTQLATNSDKAFAATGSHTTILSGTTLQLITFATPHLTAGSRFAKLYRLNPNVETDALGYVSISDIQTSAKLRPNSLWGTGGTLVPAFSPDVFDYTYVLPKDTDSTTITALPQYQSPTSVMTMNGDEVTSVNVPAVPYNGKSIVTIIVRAIDDIAVNTYTVKVERLNMDLKSIGIAAGSGVLVPAFDPDVESYTVNIPASVETATVTPLADNPDTTFTINGQATASKALAPKPGESVTASIVLTGQDGVTHRTYTVRVTRAALLSGLGISAGTLTYPFSSPVADYVLNLPSDQDTVTITPVRVASECDAVTVGGTADTGTYTLALGEQKQVAVVASSGSTHFTYNLTIVRLPIISAFVQSPIANSILTPAFDPEGGNFTLTVPASLASFTVNPIKVGCTKLLIDGVQKDWVTFDAQHTPLPVGTSRTLTIEAQAGALSRTFLLTVVKKPIITNLTVSQGTLCQAANPANHTFSPDVTSYTVDLPATSGAISVAPTLLSGTATINGTAYNASSPVVINPAPGSQGTFTVVGNDGGGSITYTITVTRHKPLTGITLSSSPALTPAFTAALSPVFDAATQTYTVNVPAAITSVTITPGTTAQCAAMTINGAAVASVTLSPGVGLSADAEIVATGPGGGPVTTYTVKVIRQALLGDIKLSSGALTPGFAGSTADYVVYLPNTTTSITVTPVKTASCASFTINNLNAASVVLKPDTGGLATATIKATGTGGITQTYTVKVYRISPVTAIKLSAGTLSPAFSLSRGTYTVSVPATTASITVTPVKGASCEKMLIDGVEKTSAVLSPQIGCSASTTVTVEAVNGQTYSYTVTMTRAALLRGITLISGTALTPAFSVAVLNYDVYVPVTTSSVKVSPVKASAGVYSMLINSRRVTSVTLTPAVGGAATATIKLTASDKRLTQTYKVTVHRAPLLTGISTSAGTMAAFNPITLGYTITLPADTSSTTLTYTKAATGVYVTMNGTNVASLDVNVSKPGGAATVSIVAKASASSTVKVTYTVTVRRAPVMSGITVTGGKLSPAFSPITGSYTISVPATTATVRLTPVRATGCTSVTIDGVEAASKDLSPVIGGSISATIVAKTAAGTTSTYTVKVMRAALVTGLKTSTTAYKITPAFSATTLNYTVTIPATRTSITIYATKARTGVKSLTMNGRAVTSLLVKPAVGKSVVVTVVATATDGKTKSTYYVTVKRSPLLSSITAEGGTLSPAFDAAAHTYTINIPATQANVKLTVAGTTAARTIKINNVTTKTVTLTPAVGGSSTATISILATDGRTKDTYTVKVNRLAPLTNITMTADGAPVSIPFNPVFTAYAVYNIPAATSVTITPVKAAGCSFTINGDVMTSITLTKPVEGTETVIIIAKSADGLTSITYTVTLTWL